MANSSERGVKLYVKYIPISFTSDSLKKILSQFGNVISVNIETPALKYTKFSYGFVMVANMRDALNIIENVNKKPPVNLLVELAKPRDKLANKFSITNDHFGRSTDDENLKHCHTYSNVNGIVNGDPQKSNFIDNGEKSFDIINAPDKIKMGSCIKCSKPASHRCSVCKVYYCSKNCQYVDWFDHQFKCRPPPPLEEATDFSTEDDDKPFVHKIVPNSIAEKVSVHEKDSYSFSRLLKDDYSSSVRELANCDNQGIKLESNISQINEIPRKNVLHESSEEHLFSSFSKDIPDSHLQTADKFMKYEPRSLSSPLNANKSEKIPKSQQLRAPENLVENRPKPLMSFQITNRLKEENVLVKSKKLFRKDIPTEEIEVDSEHTVFPTYLEDDTLYVQLVSDQKSAMVKEMTFNMASSCPKTSVPEILEQGEVICCYVSQHDTWYRGEVIKVKDREILVHLFDFGFKELVHVNDIRVCESKFRNFPVMALPVKPIYNCSQDQMRQILNNCIEDCNPLLMIVVEKTPLKVDLMDIAGKERIIPDGFIKEDTSVTLDSNFKHSKAAELLESGKVKPAMLLYEECPSTSLEIKEGVEIIILNAENPFGIFAAPVESVNLFEDLETLSIEMNEYCNSLDITYYEPQEGEVCCARFSADNQWYRAACIIRNKDSASVVFVDYGNEEVVSFKNMCQMVDKFLSIPLLALHCQIKGFTKEEVNSWGPKLEEKFKSILPSNSIQVVNVVEKCEVSQIYILEIPSLSLENLKKEIFC